MATTGQAVKGEEEEGGAGVVVEVVARGLEGEKGDKQGKAKLSSRVQRAD